MFMFMVNNPRRCCIEGRCSQLLFIRGSWVNVPKCFGLSIIVIWSFQKKCVPNESHIKWTRHCVKDLLLKITLKCVLLNTLGVGGINLQAYMPTAPATLQETQAVDGPLPCSLEPDHSCPEDKDCTQHALLLFLPLSTFFCAELSTKSHSLELCWRTVHLVNP